MLGELGITGDDMAATFCKTLYSCHLEEISKITKTTDRTVRVITHTLRWEVKCQLALAMLHTA